MPKSRELPLGTETAIQEGPIELLSSGEFRCREIDLRPRVVLPSKLEPESIEVQPRG